MNELNFPADIGIKIDYPVYLDDTDAAWEPMLKALWEEMCCNPYLPGWEPEINELVPLIRKAHIELRDKIEYVYVHYSAAVVVMNGTMMHSIQVVNDLTLHIPLDDLMDAFGDPTDTRKAT